MGKVSKKKERKIYGLSFANHTDGKELFHFSGTSRKLAFVLGIALFFMGLALICLIVFTPIRELIPGYPTARSRRELVRNAFVIDSLTREMKLWQLQLSNIQRIAVGKDPFEIDSVLLMSGFGDTVSVDAKEELAAKDSILRAVVEQEDSGDSKKQKHSVFKEIEKLHLYAPIAGNLVKDFSDTHASVELSAPENSVVFAVHDGTMISADYTEDKGYVIQIQHPGNLVSIYRFTAELLKTPGDAITSGMPIAISGSLNGKGGGGKLQFELWYNGTALNPSDYIKF